MTGTPPSRPATCDDSTSAAVDIEGEEPTALYRFYGRDGALLYVGITVNLARRWEEHAAEKAWWAGVARKTVALYGSREEALAAEAVAIVAESPVHNIAGRIVTRKGSGREGVVKRLEQRVAGAKRALRQTVFVLDDEFQSGVDAYAEAHGCSSDSAVGILLCLGLAKAEEITAKLAASQLSPAEQAELEAYRAMEAAGAAS